jgi:hypothetical protein
VPVERTPMPKLVFFFENSDQVCIIIKSFEEYLVVCFYL